MELCLTSRCYGFYAEPGMKHRLRQDQQASQASRGQASPAGLGRLGEPWGEPWGALGSPGSLALGWQGALWSPKGIPGTIPGTFSGGRGRPKICRAPPGDPQKTQNQRTRGSDSGRVNTTRPEIYERIIFSYFSVSGPSGHHVGRPGVPRGPFWVLLGPWKWCSRLSKTTIFTFSPNLQLLRKNRGKNDTCARLFRRNCLFCSPEETPGPPGGAQKAPQIDGRRSKGGPDTLQEPTENKTNKPARSVEARPAQPSQPAKAMPAQPPFLCNGSGLRVFNKPRLSRYTGSPRSLNINALKCHGHYKHTFLTQLVHHWSSLSALCCS